MLKQKNIGEDIQKALVFPKRSDVRSAKMENALHVHTVYSESSPSAK